LEHIVRTEWIKMVKNRKGISTFIATLLLMVLAVSAGVVIYAYTMGYLGGFGGTEQLGAMTCDEYSADAGGNITAYVRNVGKTTVVLNSTEGASVYVDGEAATSWTAIDIEEGDVEKVEIDPASALSAGKTYEVKIIAADNTQVSFSVKAD
jgi:hypothetical protein